MSVQRFMFCGIQPYKNDEKQTERKKKKLSMAWVFFVCFVSVGRALIGQFSRCAKPTRKNIKPLERCFLFTGASLKTLYFILTVRICSFLHEYKMNFWTKMKKNQI